MGSELVSDATHDEWVGDDVKSNSTLSYTEIFYKCLPDYLAMGMSLEDFWNCDPKTYKAYRDSYKIRYKHENELLWLQGMYVYEALCDVAPRFNSLKPKKGTDFTKKPYVLFPEDKEKPKTYDDEALDYMKAWANRVNKNYGRRII